MARKVKFALELKDGFQARNNIDEIREHFDYGKMVEHFLNNRKLERWLEDRHYEAEAIALSALDINSSDFKEKFCYIFHVDDSTVDNEECVFNEHKEKRLSRARQYTADENTLKNIDKIAFDNKELVGLLNAEATEVYLCGKKFTIPETVSDVKFIGIGTPTAMIMGDAISFLANNNVTFENISLIGEEGNSIQIDISDEKHNEQQIEKEVWPKVAAELLGVMIHGELKNGTQIFSREGHKREAGTISYIPLEENELKEDINTQLKEHFFQYNKAIIGMTTQNNRRSANQHLIFGDKALYLQFIDGTWHCIRYEKITKVQVFENSNLAITRCNKSQRWFMPYADMWKSKIGLNNFRLFLLIVAKILGDCRYEFTKEELKKLKRVKLTSLNDDCILNYLRKHS